MSLQKYKVSKHFFFKNETVERELRKNENFSLAMNEREFSKGKICGMNKREGYKKKYCV